MQIRESTENDKDAILRIHQDAFGGGEGESVSRLAIDLLEDKTAMPLLSLVAEEESTIVGHIIFTSVSVGGSATSNAYILAPLAVINNQQSRGIGTALITQGLKVLRERNADFVLVLGEPDYYSRTGFEASHSISPPYELEYPEAWMAQELKERSTHKYQRYSSMCKLTKFTRILVMLLAIRASLDRLRAASLSFSVR